MPDPIFLYPVLLISGILAGLVDAIAGGGGLVSVPVLLWIGLPPQQVLGTNKFQSTFGSFTAAFNYAKSRTVLLSDCYVGIFVTFIGAVLGTWTLQKMDTNVLEKFIPILLIFIAIYTILTPDIGTKNMRPRIPMMIFYLVFGPILGFYDGFFGPGVGSFWAMAFVFFAGFNMTSATGHTKVMNFTSNIVSLCVFIYYGDVYFRIGLCMAVGQAIGARMGSGMVIRWGAKFIRPVFIAVIVATSIKLWASFMFKNG